MDPLPILASLPLLLAVCSLWAWRLPIVWGSLSLAALVLAWSAGYLTWLGVVETVVFVGLVSLHPRTRSLPTRLAAGLVITLLGAGLMLALLPGVIKWRLTDLFYLSPSSYPYRMSFNFTKPIVGVVLVGLMFPVMPNLGRQLVRWVRTSSYLWLGGVLVVGLLAYFLGYIRWAPKAPEIGWMSGHLQSRIKS